MAGFRPRFFVTPAVLLGRSPIAGDAAGPVTGAGEGETDPAGSEVTLGPDDSHHAAHVLRLAAGDACEVVVGATVYAATVVSAETPVRVRLDARLDGAAAGAAFRVRVGLVQDVGRPALVDHVIEKGTEVGASFFFILSRTGSARSSASGFGGRLARWERIAREAAKQSKQVVVPAVRVCASLGAAIAATEAGAIESIVLEPGAPRRLDEVLLQTVEAGRSGAAYQAGVEGAVAGSRSIALWVGSEGGWTAAERETFANAGFETARLGRSVLRTETAGPVAVAVARFALGDW